MRKIPTLFERMFEDHRVVGITDKVTPGMEWVLEGEGAATIKHDGACCAIIDGKLYKRYDAKNGKKPPEGAIPCCDPDPITGHWPHWVLVNELNPADKWFVEAMRQKKAYYGVDDLPNGTYEAVGPHFQGNPYDMVVDTLIRHGIYEVDVERNFDDIREYLRTHDVEGIVFWREDEPQCKIKRTDFGFTWPVKR